MIREISLDENGKPDGIYEYFPFNKGLTVGYKFSSDDRNYLREYVYEFNDWGHWISQVGMNDGEAKRLL